MTQATFVILDRRRGAVHRTASASGPRSPTASSRSTASSSWAWAPSPPTPPTRASGRSFPTLVAIALVGPISNGMIARFIEARKP